MLKKQLRWWGATLSIFATLLSPISFLGLVGNGYLNGYKDYFAQFGVFIALPIIFMINTKLLEYESVFAYLEDRFTTTAKRLSLGLWTFFQWLRVAVVLFIPAIALEGLTGVSSYVWVALLVMSSYFVAAGGLLTVVRFDSIFAILLILAIVLVWINMLLSDVQVDVSATPPPFSVTALVLLGATFSTANSYIISPDILARFRLVGKHRLRRTIFVNGLIGAGFTALLYCLGVALFNQGFIAKADAVFMSYAQSQGFWVSTLVVVGVLLAAQTTISTSYQTVQQMYNRKYFLPLSATITTAVAIVLINADIVSGYNFFISYVGLCLAIVSSLVVLGLVFKQIPWRLMRWVFAAAVICTALVRQLVTLDMWLYNLTPFVVGFTLCFVLTLLRVPSARK